MTPVNYSFELEQRVLENLMHFENHKSEKVQKAFLKLTHECFYNPDTKKLFSIVKNCFIKQESFHFVDILVILGADNKELSACLAWIMDNYQKYHVSESTFESDIDRLIILNNLRKQLRVTEFMLDEVRNCHDPIEAQMILKNRINEISNLNYSVNKIGISGNELAEAYYDGKLGEDSKIATTCSQLNDALNGGIMPKSLIIVAAGASVGKTGFSIFLLDCIARAQVNTESLFFSIEMESKHIWLRHVGICGGKQFEKLNSEERFQAIASREEIPIKIYDTSMSHAVSDIDFILTTSRLRAMENKISVIVVDYLGLVQNKTQFERNDLKQSDVTSKLAQLAIELNCTVIALSQINRGASNRANDDRCPWPHDAADSSGGHRSSTLWLGVDRPELYQEDVSYKNQFVVKCRKNRFGDTFELVFAFNEGTFLAIEPGYFRKPYAKSKNPEHSAFGCKIEHF